jgi:cytochrome c oxidase accessory protein FixG
MAMVASTAPAREQELPLFAPHEKVYPHSVRGKVRRVKWAVLIACLTLYYIGPWLRWSRGPGYPDQALLIDMTGPRAYFFGLEIWPQEVYFLAGLLIFAAVGLFLVTSLFGRVWCGFTCPQTVWTDLFLWAERLVEGDRAQRIRLDEQRLSVAKVAKKSLKHTLWLVIAVATGGAWIMYFNDAPTLMRDLFTLDASAAQYSFVGLFTVTTYVLAGWAREQVCTYMCPWPRIQSAMIDDDTLAVTYRDWRGEPRGKHKKGDSWQGRGDCVDCRACVAVCPTGTDIRDGLQLECIGCGLCIDACNDIMDRVGRPRGLIAFDTDGARVAGKSVRTMRLRWLRPRTLIYAALLLAVGLTMVTALAMRSTVDLGVIADRAPLFVRLADGEIRDGYTLHIANKSRAPRFYRVTASGVPGAAMHIAEYESPPVPAEEGMTVEVRGDGIGTFRAYVQAPSDGHAERPMSFAVRETTTGESAVYAAVFRGPGG